jgi:hypothetical protein
MRATTDEPRITAHDLLVRHHIRSTGVEHSPADFAHRDQVRQKSSMMGVERD